MMFAIHQNLGVRVRERGPIFLVCCMTHTATQPKNPAHTIILIIPAVEF